MKSQWPFYYLTKSPHFLNIKVSKWLKITDKLWGVRLNWALMSTHLDGLANLLSITWSPSILKSILKATATKFLENTRTYFVLLYPFPATKVSGIWETIQSNILVLIGQSHRDWTEIRLIVSTWNTWVDKFWKKYYLYDKRNFHDFCKLYSIYIYKGARKSMLFSM